MINSNEFIRQQSHVYDDPHTVVQWIDEAVELASLHVTVEVEYSGKISLGGFKILVNGDCILSVFLVSKLLTILKLMRLSAGG